MFYNDKEIFPRRHLHMIGIRTAESAAWHALMTKSQVISQIQLPEIIETYVSRLVIRAMTKAAEENACETFYAGSDTEQGELHMIGDECLMLAGLMPEMAIREEIPVSYFVDVAFRAYSQLSEDSRDPIYNLLAEHLVDCIDVLHTLREIDIGSSCIDPLNAFELWQEAGSNHAWQYLTSMTNAYPVSESSTALH